MFQIIFLIMPVKFLLIDAVCIHQQDKYLSFCFTFFILIIFLATSLSLYNIYYIVIIYIVYYIIIIRHAFTIVIVQICNTKSVSHVNCLILCNTDSLL